MPPSQACRCSSSQQHAAPAPKRSSSLGTCSRSSCCIRGFCYCGTAQGMDWLVKGQSDNRHSGCRRSSSGEQPLTQQPLTQQQRHQRRREKQERQARSAAKQRLERDELLRRNSRGSRPIEGGHAARFLRRNGSDLFDKPSGGAQQMSFDRFGAWQIILMPGAGVSTHLLAGHARRLHGECPQAVKPGPARTTSTARTSCLVEGSTLQIFTCCLHEH